MYIVIIPKLHILICKYNLYMTYEYRESLPSACHCVCQRLASLCQRLASLCQRLASLCQRLASLCHSHCSYGWAVSIPSVCFRYACRLSQPFLLQVYTPSAYTYCHVIVLICHLITLVYSNKHLFGTKFNTHLIHVEYNYMAICVSWRCVYLKEKWLR